jgi:predicted nucleic acid-binding protein
MLSLRLVVDANVMVSVALKPAGLPRTVLLVTITKPARLYVSRDILQEYREVLSRTELGIRNGLLQQLMELIKRHSHMVVRRAGSRWRAMPMTTYFWNVPMRQRRIV